MTAANPMMSTETPSLPVFVRTPSQAAEDIAAEILELVASRARAGRCAVLGLATGRTPLEIYAVLARRVREERLSLANVVTFNLDEFLGLAPAHPQSFRRYMCERVFGPLGIEGERGHLPASDVSDAHTEAHCRAYERAIAEAGGIDLQVLGIGSNGHIGFNEPGSARDSRTRVVELADSTRRDAAAAFGGLERVPRRAITMGVATILDARRIRVLAFGAHKRDIVRRTLESTPGSALPATFLHGHGDVRLYADLEALGTGFQGASSR